MLRSTDEPAAGGAATTFSSRPPRRSRPKPPSSAEGSRRNLPPLAERIARVLADLCDDARRSESA